MMSRAVFDTQESSISVTCSGRQSAVSPKSIQSWRNSNRGCVSRILTDCVSWIKQRKVAPPSPLHEGSLILLLI